MDNFVIQSKKILIKNTIIPKNTIPKNNKYSTDTKNNKNTIKIIRTPGNGFKFWKNKEKNTNLLIPKHIDESSLIYSSFENMVKKLKHDRKINNNFRKVMNYFKPFDLLLFDSDDPVSTFINTIQNIKIKGSKWSHVGILINKSTMPHIKNLENDKWYIWEAVITQNKGILPSAYKVVDVETRQGVVGVQIRDLEKVLKEKLKKKGQRFAIAKLINYPNDQNLLSKVKKIQEQYFHRKYDFNIMNHISTVIDTPTINLPFNKKTTKTSIYCSEFVAIVYKKLGLLSENIDETKISPTDLINRISNSKQNKNLLIKSLIVQETIFNLVEEPIILF